MERASLEAARRVAGPSQVGAGPALRAQRRFEHPVRERASPDRELQVLPSDGWGKDLKEPQKCPRGAARFTPLLPQRTPVSIARPAVLPSLSPGASSAWLEP